MCPIAAGSSTGVTTLIHPAIPAIAAAAGGYEESARTLVKDGPRHATTRTGTLRSRRPLTSDWSQVSARMTATLSAELEGTVAHDLIADIVRAILDESRHTVQDQAVEPMMMEARQRVERLIRARTSR